MKCVSSDCDNAPTVVAMWPGKGAVPFCENCLKRAEIIAQALGFDLASQEL
jgi:hypothetical protein